MVERGISFFFSSFPCGGLWSFRKRGVCISTLTYIGSHTAQFSVHDMLIALFSLAGINIICNSEMRSLISAMSKWVDCFSKFFTAS